MLALASVATTMLACRGGTPGTANPPTASAALPQVAGSVVVDGLSAPVTVVRDRWGVPHITASNTHDLFFTQGFVQAQDRLFQMDLWRRSVQGRVSEVLGANFIERDAMTRRVQYRGSMEAEWTSYGPEAKEIATAFTNGVNAWVATLGDALPDEFRLAGWSPERWRPEDLLNRTDAFLASTGAQDEVFRARLGAAIGLDQVDALWPPADGRRSVLVPGVDLSALTYVLGDTLRRVGTPPFFSGLAAPLGAGSNAWVVPGNLTDGGAPLLAVDPHRSLDAPSLRYLVHLTAPGWNVIGATAPWMPGVAIGHNDRVAWGMTAAGADVQDIYVERTNPDNPRQVERSGRWVDMEVEQDAVAVKGRAAPFDYERFYTAHGVVVGLDSERHLAYTLRWSGTEPGGAAELAALALDRAGSAAEFRSALARWKMPVVDVIYADRDGRVGQQQAGAVPVRRGADGRTPSEGWSGAHEWVGWLSANRLPHREGAAPLVSANGNLARTTRIVDVLAQTGGQSVDSFKRLQHDVRAWNAERLVPLLGPLRAGGDVEAARARLLVWDRHIASDSAEASLYITWEIELTRLLADRRVPAEFAADTARRLPLVRAITTASPAWFDGNRVAARDALLLAALEAALKAVTPGGRAVTFAHALGVSPDAVRRFNIGPYPVSGYGDTVLSISADGRVGPSFRGIFDLADWDRSVATNAPGQSAWSRSPHAADLAALWAAGEYFPLSFSAEAVGVNTESTLVLAPR